MTSSDQPQCLEPQAVSQTINHSLTPARLSSTKHTSQILPAGWLVMQLTKPGSPFIWQTLPVSLTGRYWQPRGMFPSGQVTGSIANGSLWQDSLAHWSRVTGWRSRGHTIEFSIFMKIEKGEFYMAFLSICLIVALGYLLGSHFSRF